MRGVPLLLALLLLWPLPAHGQRLTVRVVDEAARRPLAEVSVTLLAADSTALGVTATDPDGFFQLRLPGPGEYRLLLGRIGYAPVIQHVTAGSADLSLPAIRMQANTVLLDTLRAEGRRRRRDIDTGLGLRRFNTIAGARLAWLERVGASGQALVRELGAGLRVRPVGASDYCVESTRSIRSLGASRGCSWVAVIIDDVTVGHPEDCRSNKNCFVAHFFRTFRADEWESIQYVSPLHGGYRYGFAAGANGAILVYTRGFGPLKDPARNAYR